MSNLRKYGVESTVYFPLVDFGATDYEATPVTFATGDTKLSKDGAALANTSNDPSHVGGGIYKLVLTATEMQHGGGTVVLVDQNATKEWEDQAIVTETYGDASALHETDLDTPIANQVWDALIASHIVASSFGELVQQGTVITGAAVNSESESYVLTTGTQSANAYTDTRAVDGVEHQHTDVGNALDLYYQFDIGGDGLPTGVVVEGRVNGANDSLDGIYAYNWAATSWDRIGDFTGQAGPANVRRTYNLLVSHVGTGANSGKVRIRFWAASGLTTATLYVDQILCSYAVASRTVGYANGAVWIDTTGSNTNTETYVDGVADNPVSTIAAARTIADALGLKRFQVASGSSFALAQSYAGYEFYGVDYAVDLNGQSMSGSVIEGGDIAGNDSGSNADSLHLHDCMINSNTLGLIHVLRSEMTGAHVLRSEMTGALVLAEAGHYVFDQCFSGVAGVLTPSIDVGAALGDTDISIRHYSGGFEFRNLGQAGTDIVSIEGDGQVKLAASCVGGTVAIRGSMNLTDSSGGAVTVSDDARLTKTEIGEAADTVLTASHGAGSWTGTAIGGSSMVTLTIDDGADPVVGAMVRIYNSANTGNPLRTETTDALGQVSFSIDDGTYAVRVTKSGYSFTTPETLTVSGATTDTYSGTSTTTIPDPSAASLCVVFDNNVHDIAGVALTGTVITYWSNIPQASTAGLVEGTKKTATVAAGVVSFELERGKIAHIKIPDADINHRVTVPDAASVALKTLLGLD
jgi:hypothetical protein